MNTALPDFSIPILSVRQPWAWLLANGWKNVENRNRRTHHRGPFLIHAAQGMTKSEYCAAIVFVAGFAPTLVSKMPAFEDLERGGIVGQATLLDCVTQHDSEWFCGPFGYVIADAKPLPFFPMSGQLGFWKHKPKENAP